MRRLLLGLAALLACGVIVAGCGDDDDDSTADDSPATTESAPTATTGAPTDTTDDSTDTTGDGGSVDQAVESCKENVQTTASQLSEELRGELEDLCEKAASGDEDDVREATAEACKKIIEETFPEGTEGRDEALDGCESAAP